MTQTTASTSNAELLQSFDWIQPRVGLVATGVTVRRSVIHRRKTTTIFYTSTTKTAVASQIARTCAVARGYIGAGFAALTSANHSGRFYHAADAAAAAVAVL